MMKRLWAALEQKGKIATIIGFFLAAPFNIWVLIKFFTAATVTTESLWVVSIMNGVAMVWFILPSAILLKSDKFTLEIKD